MNVPLDRIDTVFLDVGNTLVSHDFEGICALLRDHGVDCGADDLRRAEAAARPALSRWLASGRSTEAGGTLETYLALTLEQLGKEGTDPSSTPDLIQALAPKLKADGLLFSRALAGMGAALRELRATGPELIAVSNSDGTVERLLDELDLRAYLVGVIDSALVGFEKPDPAIFHHTLERFGRAPETTLHVGDIYSVDVQGARAAGLHAALVDPYDDWDGVDCLRVRDVADLARRFREARDV